MHSGVALTGQFFKKKLNFHVSPGSFGVLNILAPHPGLWINNSDIIIYIRVFPSPLDKQDGGFSSPKSRIFARFFRRCVTLMKSRPGQGWGRFLCLFLGVFLWVFLSPLRFSRVGKEMVFIAISPWWLLKAKLDHQHLPLTERKNPKKYLKKLKKKSHPPQPSLGRIFQQQILQAEKGKKK